MSGERSALVASSVACLILGSVGVVFAFLTQASAILLDGIFNITYFATGLFTLRVSSLVLKGDDELFPYGYTFFEPLVNGIKGLLVLGVSTMALAGAIDSFLTFGTEIAMGWAVIYGAFASTVAWIVAMIMRRAAKRVESPLVVADAQNWILNAAISTAVLCAFILAFLLEKNGMTRVAPYVDPVLVTTVVVISISVPVRMAWGALLSLLNRAPSAQVVQVARERVVEGLAELSPKEIAVRVIQPGRVKMVGVHILLEDDTAVSSMDRARERLAQSFADEPSTVVDLIFTRDPQWFAPFADAKS